MQRGAMDPTDLAGKSAEELRTMLQDLRDNRLAAAEAHRQEALKAWQTREAHHLGIDFKVGETIKARYRGE